MNYKILGLLSTLAVTSIGAGAYQWHQINQLSDKLEAIEDRLITAEQRALIGYTADTESMVVDLALRGAPKAVQDRAAYELRDLLEEIHTLPKDDLRINIYGDSINWLDENGEVVE